MASEAAAAAPSGAGALGGTEALVVRGLTRRFGSRTAVSKLDLRVVEGDTYGFLGPNGAGKTTAIRCMLGLIRMDEGEVEVFGERDRVRQRRHIGAMVETPTFHTWMSGRANLERAVAYAGQGDKSDIDKALDLVGLMGRENEKVGTYSLGMRQRLGIARALVGRPKLLLLDEPTNGLDPRGMKEVRELLTRLAREEKLTIFISSHLLSEVELLCNRVGIIERGHLVAEGTVDELVGNRGKNPQVDVAVEDREALSRALTGMHQVRIVGDGGDGHEERLRLELEGISVAALNRALVDAGVAVTALVPVTHSLEDLFLALTSEEIT